MLTEATGSTPRGPDERHATYRALAVPSRQALLAALQGADGPIDALTAGAAVGLHPNTARTHLDLLCSAGLARRRTEDRSRRGRPRVLYELASTAGELLADQKAREAAGAYRELARLLAQQLTELPDVSREALRAGRRWAAVLDRISFPMSKLSGAEAVEVISDLLERLGFHPVADPDAAQIRLGHCPFLDVARDNRVVVCGVHFGLLKATLERLDTAVDVVGLEPLVTSRPIMCLVSLGASSPEQGHLHSSDDVQH